MITLHLARQLKEAGLVWMTNTNDFFAIPDRGLDDKVFVLADMMAYTELVQGWPVVAFQGTAEWALDYILTSEVVWMPTEGQLRGALEGLLFPAEQPEAQLQLIRTPDGYVCLTASPAGTLSFSAPTAEEAYALALLHWLMAGQ